MASRNVVHIDEEKCTGCGVCVPACAEGAIQIIDGKARLVSEVYCDGLGACLGKCPEDAIRVEEREADEYDVAATRTHLAEIGRDPSAAHDPAAPHAHHPPHGGCPSARALALDREDPAGAEPSAQTASRLGNWPVQLGLVPPGAPFLEGADLLVAADCVPFAYPDFHRDLLEGRALVVACPKLDDASSHIAKLTAILRESDIRSLTVARMEVPCCRGLVMAAREALAASGKEIPFEEVVLTIRGGRQTA